MSSISHGSKAIWSSWVCLLSTHLLQLHTQHILYLLANHSGNQGPQKYFCFYFLQLFLHKWTAVKTQPTLNPLHLPHQWRAAEISCPGTLHGAARPSKSVQGTQEQGTTNAEWWDMRSHRCIWGMARRREEKKEKGGRVSAQGIGTYREKPKGLAKVEG